MPAEQTLFFTCPHCGERFAQVEEPDRDIHTGETYHCGSCGIQVIFQAVTVEDYVPPPQGEKGLPLLQPRTLPVRAVIRTRQTTQRKERRHETRSSGKRRVLPHAGAGR